MTIKVFLDRLGPLPARSGDGLDQAREAIVDLTEGSNHANIAKSLSARIRGLKDRPFGDLSFRRIAGKTREKTDRWVWRKTS